MKTILFIITMLLTNVGFSQYFLYDTVYHENFDSPSYDDSVYYPISWGIDSLCTKYPSDSTIIAISPNE